MAGLSWRVRVTLDDGETVERVVSAQSAGWAAHVALGSLVVGTASSREWGPRLSSFAVDVEPAP